MAGVLGIYGLIIAVIISTNSERAGGVPAVHWFGKAMHSRFSTMQSMPCPV